MELFNGEIMLRSPINNFSAFNNSSFKESLNRRQAIKYFTFEITKKYNFFRALFSRKLFRNSRINSISGTM